MCDIIFTYTHSLSFHIFQCFVLYIFIIIIFHTTCVSPQYNGKATPECLENISSVISIGFQSFPTTCDITLLVQRLRTIRISVLFIEIFLIKQKKPPTHRIQRQNKILLDILWRDLEKWFGETATLIGYSVTHILIFSASFSCLYLANVIVCAYYLPHHNFILIFFSGAKFMGCSR
jgi:hypothetical protein